MSTRQLTALGQTHHPLLNAFRRLQTSAPGVLSCLLYSLLYLPVTLALASRKIFWNDELFTWHISALSTFPKIWNGLLTAADQNPPLFYWISRRGVDLTGSTLTGLRMPEICGVWLMGVCLIFFVRKHLPAGYGLIAAFIVLVSGAYSYSFEARPYGVVLGLAAAALLCWQRTETSRPLLWAAGLAVSLALAVSMHYYSVLLFAPVAGGELVRLWYTRKLRWPVWIAIAAGACPLFIYLPLIANARSYSGTFWAKADFGSINAWLSFVLNPALLPLTVIATAAVIVWFRREAQPITTPAAAPPVWEVAAAVGFAGIVPLAVMLGKYVTGAYTHRYALAGVLGLTLIATWLTHSAFQGRSAVAFSICGLLAAFFTVREIRELKWIGPMYDRSHLIRSLAEQTPTSEVIVIADPHLFMELSWQAPEPLRSRLLYVADRQVALRRLGTDAVERGIIDMQPLASLHVSRLAEFIRSPQSCLILGYPATWGWLVEELSSRRVPISFAGSVGGVVLLRTESALPVKLVNSPGTSDSGALR